MNTGDVPAPESRRMGQPYTGVVIIHGIGTEKKDETLQQVLNALAYWLNHVAGFSLRDRGPDRIWIQTYLLEDNDPDAPASRATVELSGSAASGAAEQTLYLEMREVWWAQAFGLPSTSSALSWAQVQFRQELSSILRPIWQRLTMPARMLFRRDVTAATSTEIGNDPAKYFSESPQPSRGHFLPGILRALLQAFLAVYDLIQDVWKSLEFILGIPLVLLLLWIAGVVRLLAPLPGFSAVLQGVSALINLVSLHWIAPMQVYLLDYTYGTNIRERFQRQLQPFLDDELCRRVVVIAHSMGNVVAYEGLTGALAEKRSFSSEEKDISFISLGQALHRIWPLSRTDPHRLRGVLPSRVRWINFWARFDPVAAGDLGPNSLAPARDWDDPDEPNPDPAIRKTLERVENVRVVNHDSLLSDHVSYWDNAEQVLGPLASELVRGAAGVQERVERHLATSDAVLLRRWTVAWRSSLDMAAGAVSAVLMGYLALPDARLGYALVSDAGLLINSIGFASALLSLIGNAFHSITAGNNPLARALAHLRPAAAPISHGFYGLVTVVVILLIVSVVVELVRTLLPIPSPFVFSSPNDRVRVTPAPPKAPRNPGVPQPVMPSGSPGHRGQSTAAGGSA